MAPMLVRARRYDVHRLHGGLQTNYQRVVFLVALILSGLCNGFRILIRSSATA